MKNTGGSSFFRFPEGDEAAADGQNAFGNAGEDEDLYN
jgi:transitional endoplasmic reticulum ATPase